MVFVGRTAELGRLRTALDRREASVVRIAGIRGGGKSALVRRVVTDYDGFIHPTPPLPDLAQRERLMALVSRTRTDRGRSPHLATPSPAWSELLAGLLDVVSAGGRPFALVLDDAHRLTEARSRYLEAVVELVTAARAQGRPLHVVLVGPQHAMPSDDALPSGSPPLMRIGPLPFRAATALLPGSRPNDLLRAYGVFGGIPRVLAALDRDVALGTNLRRLVLAENASLADAGGVWLERDVQTPARYYAILSTLARGETEWANVHAGLPDLTRSGQVAPYLKRLEELGLITSRRSLDAGPRSRSRRYALADPFLATWSRFVLDARASVDFPDGSDVYSALVRPALDEHITCVFPLICRHHMALDAIESIGETAREGGSLWGAEYDLPVAGILHYGSAYYGTCLWQPPGRETAPLEALDRQIRETRYGFGRERRLRLVFTGHDAPQWLQRRVARRHDAHLIDAAALAGRR